MSLPPAPLEVRMGDFWLDTKADRGGSRTPRPEALAHIGAPPGSTHRRAQPVDGSGPMTRAYDESDRRQPWQANPMY
jgi:hypothetical protein